METASASILYVGLDVHKESIDIATADEGRDGEVRHVGRIGGDLAALDKALLLSAEVNRALWRRSNGGFSRSNRGCWHAKSRAAVRSGFSIKQIAHPNVLDDRIVKTFLMQFATNEHTRAQWLNLLVNANSCTRQVQKA